MLSPTSKIKVQNFGQLMSSMIMPNIGAFIAWGLISALFIPSGWMPNANLATLIQPIMVYLLPMLIAHTGGRIVGGERGAVVGAITTMGLVVGSEVPMLMGAMITGPLGGAVIKLFDYAVRDKVKSGFEMLVNNFSAGIIGMLGAIVSYLFIGPATVVVTAMLMAAVEVLVDTGSLVFISIFIEPAKILFLNNAINHGIFTTLGIQQVQQTGQSIFFLLESNPGPGLGLLLAYVVTTKDRVKQTAGGATIIHLFGGIQEVYFPYILMKPKLLLAVIAGGMTGVFVLIQLNAGLVSPASPGSIVAIFLMTPQESLIGVSLSVAAATLVSFVVAVSLLKMDKRAELRQAKLTRSHGSRAVGLSLLFDIELDLPEPEMSVSKDNVFLGLTAHSKEEAIQFAGEQLVRLGYAEPDYVNDMQKREALISTYLGDSIALPHGVLGGKQNIIKTGIVFCQYPEGVQWGAEIEDVAKVVIAIAAKGDSHIKVISTVSSALDDDEALENLMLTTDVDQVVQALNREV